MLLNFPEYVDLFQDKTKGQIVHTFVKGIARKEVLDNAIQLKEFIAMNTILYLLLVFSSQDVSFYLLIN